jgi:hypothetical protein
MRKIFSLLFNTVIVLLSLSAQAQNVGIGTNTPHTSAQLDVSSSSGGFLPPRITGQQRDAIVNPAAGLILFCTDCGEGEMQYYSGSTWRSMNMGVALKYPIISSLNCAGAVNNGNLTTGTAASGVNSVVPYNGGNGGTFAGQIISSTGVTGLTATLAVGTLANGSGNLTYNITGTPATSGTASFALSIGGQSCTLTRTVDASVPNTVTDASNNTYPTVTIGTQVWMAENLRTTKYRVSGHWCDELTAKSYF